MKGPYVSPPTAEMAKRYEAGDTPGALAEVYDVSESTIRNRLRAAGVKMRPCGAPPGNDHARKARQ